MRGSQVHVKRVVLVQDKGIEGVEGEDNNGEQVDIKVDNIERVGDGEG